MNDKESKKSIISLADNFRWELGENFHDNIMESIFNESVQISNKVVKKNGKQTVFSFDQKLDKIVTSRILGFPIMLFLLALVFWLTIVGANVPSDMLFSLLIDKIHPLIKGLFVLIGIPNWITGLLIDGGYMAMAWVVAVMLPPMAIFFPMFTLLEDFGYLPRVAFNMDNLFRKVGAHGKQALTMSMGFGCNAAGVVAARVIDSPRERLIAIITNNFSLCNGRWPTQILIASIFIGALVKPAFAGIVSAGAVVGIAVLGILFSLIVSWGLSRSVLKGEASTFSLELPPYRPPRILQTLYTSLIDRTLVVLWRAIIFAFPAGLVIWLVSNITIEGASLATYIINSLNPFGVLLGMNGVILLAFIIAIPANEIVVPTILMLTVLSVGLNGVGQGAGVLFDLSSTVQTADILHQGGWTLLTAVNIMLFSLLHNPCSTTIFTIYKETRSLKWTIFSTLLPVAMGIFVTFIVAQVWAFFI